MRCYFHLVSCHDVILDDTGVEVADLENAEAEARKAIQELCQEDDEPDDHVGGLAAQRRRRLRACAAVHPFDHTAPLALAHPTPLGFQRSSGTPYRQGLALLDT